MRVFIIPHDTENLRNTLTRKYKRFTRNEKFSEPVLGIVVWLVEQLQAQLRSSFNRTRFKSQLFCSIINSTKGERFAPSANPISSKERTTISTVVCLCHHGKILIFKGLLWTIRLTMHFSLIKVSLKDRFQSYSVPSVMVKSTSKRTSSFVPSILCPKLLRSCFWHILHGRKHQHMKNNRIAKTKAVAIPGPCKNRSNCQDGVGFMSTILRN